MSVRTSPRRQAARRRRPRWTPPPIHTRYVRSSDQAVHTITNIYRVDEQVQLTPVGGGKPVYVYALELDTGWEQIA